jgi:hypothetical protein
VTFTFTFTELHGVHIEQYKCFFFFLNDNLGSVKIEKMKNLRFTGR